MLVLSEAEIRACVDAPRARVAIADAFRALQRGEATLGSVISLPFHDPAGVAHIKAGHLHGDAIWTVKVSTDLDPGDGSGTLHGGVMLVLSSRDAAPVAMLLDNGFLTELRTGAAGAVAADLLARPDATTAAIVGAGSQARYQLEALLGVRAIERVRIASRTRSRAEDLATEVRARHGLEVEVCGSCEEAVRAADIVVTTTQSTRPLVEAAWLRPGTHVTAVGSDEPDKQELAVDVLARADVVAVDDRGQTARFGELHHALEAGARDVDSVVTLGELLEGMHKGRKRAEDITVADLTGVGIQDAAIAALTLREATRLQTERVR